MDLLSLVSYINKNSNRINNNLDINTPNRLNNNINNVNVNENIMETKNLLTELLP
jgi:hypothetical protein